MPRIDPSQLLRTLSVLLAKDGGIRSAEEVVLFDNFVLEIIVLFSGSSDCAVDAEVLQEAGVQMYLHPHPVFQQPRAPREFSLSEGMGSSQYVVL